MAKNIKVYPLGVDEAAYRNPTPFGTGFMSGMKEAPKRFINMLERSRAAGDPSYRPTLTPVGGQSFYMEPPTTYGGMTLSEAYNRTAAGMAGAAGPSVGELQNQSQPIPTGGAESVMLGPVGPLRTGANTGGPGGPIVNQILQDEARGIRISPFVNKETGGMTPEKALGMLRGEAELRNAGASGRPAPLTGRLDRFASGTNEHPEYIRQQSIGDLAAQMSGMRNKALNYRDKVESRTKYSRVTSDERIAQERNKTAMRAADQAARVEYAKLGLEFQKNQAALVDSALGRENATAVARMNYGSELLKTGTQAQLTMLGGIMQAFTAANERQVDLKTSIALHQELMNSMGRIFSSKGKKRDKAYEEELLKWFGFRGGEKNAETLTKIVKELGL